MIDTNKDWEKLGRTDLYYGALSCDKFRTEKFDGVAIEEFFGLSDDPLSRTQFASEATSLVATFLPTPKNNPCLDFFRPAG